MNNRKALMFLSALLMFAVPSLLYAFQFKEISSDAGLSSRWVRSIAHDTDGYLWFATHTGIDRYNGSSFKNYSLSTNIDNYLELPRGIISNQKGTYAFSENNLYYYSPHTDSFQYLGKHSFKGSINVIMGHGHEIWVGTYTHLYCYDLQKKTTKTMAKNISVWSLCAVEGSVMAGTSNGLLAFKVSSSGRVSTRKVLPVLRKVRIQSIYYDPIYKNLWIGTFQNGLFVYQNKTIHPITTSGQNFPVRTIKPIDQGHVWVGIDGGGIYAYSRKTLMLENIYTKNKVGADNISANSIYDIMPYANSIWIGTFSKGILVFNNTDLFPHTYHKAEHKIQSVEDNNMNDILESKDGKIWFGTNQGISVYNPATNSWNQLIRGNNTDNSVILSLFEDKAGNVWASGYSCDIVRFGKNGDMKILDIGHTKKNNFIYSIAEDPSGNLWFGGIIKGLVKYNPSNSTYQSYNIKGVNCILPLNKDILLLATSKGVMKLNKNNGYYSYLVITCHGKKKKFAAQYLCFAHGDKNTIWIATTGMGVISYHLKTGHTVQYTKKEGMSSDFVTSVASDAKGRIWAGTEFGLNCIDSSNRSVSVFYQDDGLPDNSINLRAVATLHNGNIILGTTNGAFLINTKKDLLQHGTTNLHFEDFALFNKTVYPNTENSPLSTIINHTKEIKLQYNQNSFSLNFINVSYYDRTKDLYTWKLEGIDKDWTDPSENHVATYTNMSPGKYTLRIRVYAGNKKNYQERSLAIVITEPWWNTIWAWIVYLTMIWVMVYFAIRSYKNYVDARDSDKKIRFFVNMAHDIRTPLTLIKAPLSEINTQELIPAIQSNIELAKTNTEKLLSLVTQLLDFQKAERHAMTLQVKETNIEPFIANAICYFEPLAKDKKIDLQYIFSESDSDKGFIDSRKVQIIIENLLSNAIKYTRCQGKVTLAASIHEGMLKIEVSDNGIGIPVKARKKIFVRFYRAENASSTAELGSGIGLLLTQKMVLLHKGTITYNSEENAGTTFLVHIPIAKSSYTDAEIVQAKTKDEGILSSKKEDAMPQDATEKIKVMLVEDNDDLRAYLVHVLKKDYVTVACTNGQNALDTIPSENPDFIISDVMMPILSGFDLCKKLKSDIETCHIPLILLTSLTDTQDVVRGLEAGADDYITKPFDINVLKTKIASILRNRMLFRKKYIDKSAFVDHSDKDGVNELDKEFMKRVIEFIYDNISKEELNIDSLASEMAMSRSVFFKKIKSLTGQNPQEIVRDIKMKQAATLLQERKYSIIEISEKVGFANSKYFSTAFKKYYGKSPSKFLEP